MTGASRALRKSVVFALCAAAASCAFEPSARAQVKTEKAAADQRARELFLKADAAYAEGRYEEALGAFQEAYDLSGRPQLLFNISNALERLGRYQEAVDALDKYLASGKAKDRDVVKKRLTNLKKRVEEQRAADEKAAKEEEEQRRAKEQEQEAARSKAVPGPDQPPKRPPPEPEKPPAPVLPWVLIGSGGVLLATGAVFGVLTLGARSEAKDGCTNSPSGHLCDAEVASALNREETFGLIADIGMLSGIVLGGVGTYLLLTNKPQEPYFRVGARLRTGGGGIQVGGAF